jgi:MerR family transcriptional regulator, Zn(II)-responsive regulator of zntA
VRIGEIAGRAGVPAKTIRFWEDQGLLPPPGRTPAGYRDYDPAVLDRLAFIRHALAAGLTSQPSVRCWRSATAGSRRARMSRT